MNEELSFVICNLYLSQKDISLVVKYIVPVSVLCLYLFLTIDNGNLHYPILDLVDSTLSIRSMIPFPLLLLVLYLSFLYLVSGITHLLYLSQKVLYVNILKRSMPIP